MSELVNVPVPARFVVEVYGFISQLAASETRGQQRSSPVPVGLSGHRWSQFDNWPLERLQRFSESTQASVKRTALLLDLLSQSPGNHIPLSTAATQLNVTREELRAALSGFTRWLRRSQEDDTWPFNYQSAPGTVDDVAEETHYWVSEQTARLWQQVRGDPAGG